MNRRGRRKAEPRYKFDRRVLVGRVGRDDAREEMCENLSMGGLFIRTQTPYSIGTPVEIEITAHIGGSTEVIHCTGEVVWTKEFRDEINRERSGMGIRFTDIDEKTVSKLEALLSALDED